MMLSLPAQQDNADRMRRLVKRLAELPRGRAIIDTIINDPGLGAALQLAFDQQMDSMGMCYKRSQQTTVALNPACDDATLVSVLAHELCHVIQPGMNTNWAMQGADVLHLTKSRFLEGDAFTHQFVLALGSDDHAVSDACINIICGKLPASEQAYFLQQAENFTLAQTPQEQQAVMSDIFWRIQETRLDAYDDKLLASAAQIQQGVPLKPMTSSAQHQASDFAAQLMFIPSRLPGVKYNNYLGDDPEVAAAAILTLANATKSLRQGVSIDKVMANLPYPKPASHATLTAKM